MKATNPPSPGLWPHPPQPASPPQQFRWRSWEGSQAEPGYITPFPDAVTYKKELDLRALLSHQSSSLTRSKLTAFHTFPNLSYWPGGILPPKPRYRERIHPTLGLTEPLRVAYPPVLDTAQQGVPPSPQSQDPPGQGDVRRGYVLPAGCGLAGRAARPRAAAGAHGSPRARRTPGHRGPRPRAGWRRRVACALRRGCGSRPCWWRRRQRARPVRTAPYNALESPASRAPPSLPSPPRG